MNADIDYPIDASPVLNRQLLQTDVAQAQRVAHH